MWRLWPSLRRLWAAIGAIIIGLIVTGFYSFLSKQPLPDLQIATHTLSDRWPWLGSGLVVLAIVSTVAERTYRRREVVPRPVHPTAYQRFKQRWRLRRGAVLSALTTGSFPIVGRGAELARLNDWFAQAGAGQRRVIFVSGEPGIGKTTLTRSFLDSIATDRNTRIGRGQCVEQYGAGEPYMPILEALTRLSREPGGEKLIEILHRMAPAWLAQMPSLISAEDRARLQGVAQGTTQQRMLREIAEALEVIAAETPMVLFLEDLHWSDPSTLDLIATVARRSEPARLMILGTYRPVEMLAGEHPLRAMKEELELHQQAIELRLPLLSQADVTTYLHERFTPNDSRPSPLPSPIRERDPEKIASAIYARSEGNPLFMVNVVDYVIEQGSLADADKIEAPRTIRQMIERNLQRLSPDEQRILEAASVAGAEFSAAAVAAGLERPIPEIEACCNRLARREQFIGRGPAVTWPDGTTATNFRFQHALYQNVLYDSLTDGDRVLLHRRIAGRIDQAYGEHAADIAAELANHYRAGGITQKAVAFSGLAGEQALRRGAMLEAEHHLKQALQSLLELPVGVDRDRAELDLQTKLGRSLSGAKGFSHSEARSAYMRARELAKSLGETPRLAGLLCHLSGVAFTSGQLLNAQELAEQCLKAAQRANDPALLCTAYRRIGENLCFRGDFLEADKYLKLAVAAFDTREVTKLIAAGAILPSTIAALACTHRGFPDQAREMLGVALQGAQARDNPFELIFGRMYACVWALTVRDFLELRDQSIAMKLLVTEIPGMVGHADAYLGWSLFNLGKFDEGKALLRSGIAFWRQIGFGLTETWEKEAEAQVAASEGRLVDAFKLLSHALDKEDEEISWRRVPALTQRGDLMMRIGNKPSDVEATYCEAITCARNQGSKLHEIEAATHLARLLRDTDRRDEARTMLAGIYGWFTEGFDTRDLKEAKALLEELS